MKSRYGCVRCRRRRIKCDEAKPACSQCSRKSHACEYQLPVLKWRDGLDSIRRTHGSDNNSNSCGKRTSTRQKETFPPKKAAGYQHQPDLSPTTTADPSSDLSNLGVTFQGHFGPDLTSGLLSDIPDEWTLLEQQSSIPYLTAATSFLDLLQCSIDGAVSENPESAAFSLSSPNLQTCLTPCSADLIAGPQTATIAISVPSPKNLAALVPSRVATGPSPPLSDASTGFVSHYFRHVGPLFCCCLQIDNPFVTDVAQRWNSWTSGSLPYVLQSISAAYLSESTPSLVPVAHRLRVKAKSIIEQDIMCSPGEVDQESVGFSIILLGASADWMQPRDSMLDIFQKLASLYNNNLASPNKQTFGRGIMTYWLMFLTYMSSNRPGFVHLANSSYHAILMHRIESAIAPGSYIHPWTGTSADLIDCMTLVGELIRHHCSLSGQACKDACNSRSHHYAASLLECRLLGACRASLSIENTGTSAGQMQLGRLSELYQLAALIQLYRVFPDLAKRYERFTYMTQIGFKLFQEDNLDRNLFSIAKHILDLAPQTYRDTVVLQFQLIPVIIAASELQLNSVISHNNFRSYPLGNSQDEDKVISLAQARQTTKDHLHSMHHVFPGDRISQVIDLVSSTWKSLDKGGSGHGKYWIEWLMETDQEVV